MLHGQHPRRNRCSIVLGFTTLVWTLVLLEPAVATAAVAEPLQGVSLHEGRLSVHVENRPLRQVLTEVSKLSQTEIIWFSHEGQEEPVSIDFAELPLREGLEHILRHKNFLLFGVPQSSGLQVTQLWIASDRKPTQPPAPSHVTASSPPARVQKAPTVQSHASRAPPGGTVMQRIIELATSAPNPLTRANAVVYLGAHGQDDPQLRELLERIATGDASRRVRDTATQALQRQP